MNELLKVLQKEFPNMEATVVFQRNPITKELTMSPMFKIPPDGQEFLLKQAELFQEYARALSYMATKLHNVKFRK